MSIIKEASAPCSKCGEKQVNLAKYETLYHDPEARLMVWLLPEGDISETQMKAITMHTKAMGGYTLRRVTDMGSLMEKVLIHDAGLDDVVLEMCKYVTKMEMISKITGKDNQEALMKAKFNFYHIEGEADERMITLMFPQDGQMSGVNIGWNVYQDCEGILSRNPHVNPGEGFVNVDADWLATMLA